MANSSRASAEDIENNLRLFALRKAVSSSKEFSALKNHIIIKVDSTANDNCPRHGQENSHHECHDMTSHGDYYGRERDYSDLSQHISRKEMARELRLSAARQEREAKSRVMNLSSPVLETGRRGSSFSPSPTVTYHQYTDYQRSESVDPWPQYNSMPRRMSANPTSYGNKTKPVHRHGSFQEVPYGKQPPPKVDVFKGRVDFKSILRRFDPKDDERASGGQKGSYNAPQKSKYAGGSQKDIINNAYNDPLQMPQRPPAPKRGTIVDSDFDFRGSAPALTSTYRPMSPQQMVRPLSPSVSTSSNNNMFPVHHNRPIRPQKLELEISSRKRQEPISIQTNNRPISPNSYQYVAPNTNSLPNTKSESNPVSPRRVEFSEQVFSFSFAGNEPTSSSPFPPPPLMVSSPLGKKPILRQSNSDPHTSSNATTKDKHKQLPQQQQQTKGLTLIEQFERQEIERRIQQQLRNDHEHLMSSMNMVSPLTIEHTNLDEETTSGLGESGSDGSTVLNQRRKVSSDSLVQIYVPPNKTNDLINLDIECDTRKVSNSSSDSDSDSNDVSETSGATSTSVNTTFDADVGDEDSDEGTLSASFEELEKELDRSQGEEIITRTNNEGTAAEILKTNKNKDKFVKSSTSHYYDRDDNDASNHAEQKPAGLKAMRTLSAEVSNKTIAPMLAEWNRSQSFPIPTKSNMKNVMGITGNYLREEKTFDQNSSRDETGIFLEGLPRKSSNPLTASNTSVNHEGKLSFER